MKGQGRNQNVELWRGDLLDWFGLYKNKRINTNTRNK
jgi:hypothetical protein